MKTIIRIIQTLIETIIYLILGLFTIIGISFAFIGGAIEVSIKRKYS